MLEKNYGYYSPVTKKDSPIVLNDRKILESYPYEI